MKILKRLEGMFMENGKEKDIPENRFNLLVGGFVLWALTLIITLPVLFAQAVSLIPDNIVPNAVNVAAYVILYILLVVVAPFIGMVVFLAEKTIVTEKHPILATAIGFHFMLCPFIAISWLIQPALITAFGIIAAVTIIGSVYPPAIASFPKFCLVVLPIACSLLIQADAFPKAGFSIDEGYVPYWCGGYAMVLCIGFFWRSDYAEQKFNLTSAMNSASKFFVAVIGIVAMCIGAVLQALGSETEMD